ncbi:hypothetical protein PR202_ga19562 [Eleusine coracana subsp. coracana]|uniref:Cytochrome b561 domain-containing protein n=1 Tax=Eleusine coracana subsp. coracana TaxID=191504 RepID=A0AAV5CWD2_ELECO|nr:hypothetical protein PR202_ga19562 [Eleusine coracana subsp. coracana]
MAAAGLGVTAAPFTKAAHVLGAVAAVLVLLWCICFRGGLALEHEDKNLIFNIHPVVTLIGFVILGSEAIMIYKVFPTWNHDTAKLTHIILHGIATVLGAFGIYCAFKFHNEKGIANLYSLHSWFGMTTIVLYAIQWVFGFVNFFFPGASPGVRRAALPWHVLLGIFVYVLALVTTELGFLEKLTFLEVFVDLNKYGVEAFLVNITGLVVMLLGASVIVASVTPAHGKERPRDYAPLPEEC